MSDQIKHMSEYKKPQFSLKERLLPEDISVEQVKEALVKLLEVAKAYIMECQHPRPEMTQKAESSAELFQKFENRQ